MGKNQGAPMPLASLLAIFGVWSALSYALLWLAPGSAGDAVSWPLLAVAAAFLGLALIARLRARRRRRLPNPLVDSAYGLVAMLAVLLLAFLERPVLDALASLARLAGALDAGVAETLRAAIPAEGFGLGLSLADASVMTAALVTTTHTEPMAGIDYLPPSFHLLRANAQLFGALWFLQFAMVAAPLAIYSAALDAEHEAIRRRVLEAAAPRRLGYGLGLVLLLLVAIATGAFAASGLGLLDAYLVAAGLVSLGGFVPADASLAAYPDVVQTLAIPIVLVSAMSYGAHLQAASELRPRAYLASAEIRAFLLIFLTAWALFALYMTSTGQYHLSEAAAPAAATIAFLLTTTGAAVFDPGLTGSFFSVLFLLCLIGGCAGSPSGGLRVARLLILGRIVSRLFSWRRHVRLGALRLPETALQVTPVLVILWALALTVGAGVLTAMELDMLTAFSIVAANLSNTGTALGPLAGPAGNYAALPDGAKWTICAVMLLGRLEFGVVLAFLSTRYWNSLPDAAPNPRARNGANGEAGRS